MKDLDRWRFYEGRVYDAETLKEPYVVPMAENMPYVAHNPVLVDIGSGRWSIADRAKFAWRRRISIANVDIAIPETHPLSRRQNFKLDVEDLIDGRDELAQRRFERFLAERSEGPQPKADAVIYSEILNYIDFRRALTWSDGLLKSGGFVIIANLPTRGYEDLFADTGAKSNEEVVEFCQQDLGYSLVDECYPWGQEHPWETFMVAAFQKAQAQAGILAA